MFNKKVIIAIIVFFFCAVSFFGYIFWKTYYGMKLDKPLNEHDTGKTYKEFVNILNEHGVPQEDTSHGFWTRFTDERGRDTVLFIDPKKMSKQPLTQWQMQKVADMAEESKIVHAKDMHAVSQSDLPDSLKFHNALYNVGDSAGTSGKLREGLKGKIAQKTYSVETLKKLAYLYEIEGKYKLRDKLYNRACKEFKSTCQQERTITISGKVTDKNGTGIEGATVRILTNNKSVTKTDMAGKYSLTARVRDIGKMRIGAYKRNYSDGVTMISILTNREGYIASDITLVSPLDMVTLDTIKRVVTGKKNNVIDDIATITTNRSIYKIPLSTIVHKDGSKYSGVVEVYLYEFTRDNVPENLLNVDTVDSVAGYAGDMMKSFGMPYIQFFTTEGEELHILKSKPMILRYSIYHMKELHEGTDDIYRPLTNEDMNILVNESKKGGFPIDRNFLITHKLLSFPAFWVFDRSRGVWEDIGIRVIDINGTIETSFYTINDTI